RGGGVVLGLRDTRQRDARSCIGGLDEAGAVETARSLASPQIRSAELRERVGDRRLRRRARADGAAAGGRGVAGCGAAVLVRIQAGPGEHLPHVRLGVVVRVDASGDVAGAAALTKE